MLSKVLVFIAVVGLAVAQRSVEISLNKTTITTIPAGQKYITATIKQPMYLWASVSVDNYYAIASSGLEVYYSYTGIPRGLSNESYLAKVGPAPNTKLFANTTDRLTDATMYLLFQRSSAGASDLPLTITTQSGYGTNHLIIDWIKEWLTIIIVSSVVGFLVVVVLPIIICIVVCCGCLGTCCAAAAGANSMESSRLVQPQVVYVQHGAPQTQYNPNTQYANV